MTEQQTDYITETAEAMALLRGAIVNTIEHTYDLPPCPTGYEYRYDELEDPDLASYYPAEVWLMKSTKVEAWYCYFLVEAR